MSFDGEIRIIHLKLNGEEAPLKVTEQSEFTSKHTGKLLEKVTVETVVSNKESHDILVALRKKARTEGITSIDNKGNVQKKWITTESGMPYAQSFKESDGVKTDERYEHTFELEEYEELNLKELVVDGVVLKPYFYEEDVSAGRLVVHAKAAVTKKQETKLRSLIKKGGFFSVTRRGISDESKKMENRLLRWSESKDKNKYELSFVEDVIEKGFADVVDAGQEQTTPGLADAIVEGFDRVYNNIIPPLVQTSFLAAKNKEMVDWLIDVLSEKDVLKPNDIEELRGQVKENMSERRFEFSRVPDIDNRHKRFKWSELH